MRVALAVALALTAVNVRNFAMCKFNYPIAAPCLYAHTQLFLLRLSRSAKIIGRCTKFFYGAQGSHWCRHNSSSGVNFSVARACAYRTGICDMPHVQAVAADEAAGRPELQS